MKRGVRVAEDIFSARGEMERERAAAEIALLRREKKTLMRALQEAEERAGLVDALRDASKPPAPVKTPSRKTRKRLAAAVLMCSDWHVGERVDARKVSGANRYDPQEATRRAHKLADALCWLIQHHRTSWEIDTVVIWLGGDLMTGYIHEELRESNHLSPSQEMLLVQDLVAHLLLKVLALKGIASVRVVCSYGNHGRTTAKPQISTGAENSYEWLVYHQLARTFAGEKRVTWTIADGEFVYLDVYGVTVRFTHGDAVKYGGGVGGITIPINKALARWQTHRRADITGMGHWHDYHDMPSLVVNGSLIGVGPYSQRFASYQEPAQAFFLVDAEHGKCQSTPVWVCERRRAA